MVDKLDFGGRPLGVEIVVPDMAKSGQQVLSISRAIVRDAQEDSVVGRIHIRGERLLKPTCGLFALVFRKQSQCRPETRAGSLAAVLG